MSLAPGRDLSHYRLVEQIGEGGMGVVWKATDTTLGRAVAIKVLPEAFARDPERMARFEREARLLASFNHPHIAAIYGVGSAEGVRFLAMELVDGDDLAVRLARGAIPVAETIELARQIAEALEAAHEKGIIHRDLKPANVKLTAEGQIKVLDFGLAKALEGDPAVASSTGMSHSPTITSPMTAANVILGTAAYMSPEQARGKAVDKRADIWAFGCVLYECLTGRRAFDGETVSDTIAKILEREVDWKALPPGTPPRARELLERCLEKDARQRLRDIGEARLLLGRSADASASGLRVAGSATADGRRNPWALLKHPLVLAVVLLAAVAGALLSRNVGAPRPERAVNRFTVSFPANLDVWDWGLTPDGSALILVASQRGVDSTAGHRFSRLYVRTFDNFAVRPLPGTENVFAFALTQDSRQVLFTTATSYVSVNATLSRVALDGGSPAVTLAPWDPEFYGFFVPLPRGDILTMRNGRDLFRVAAAGGAPQPLGRILCADSTATFGLLGGRAVVDDHTLLLDCLTSDSQGPHGGVAVLDLPSRRARIVLREGDNPVLSPTGHLLFKRGDALLGLRCDAHGVPSGEAIGLVEGVRYGFGLSNNGTLAYTPGSRSAARSRLVIVERDGRVTPWSEDRRLYGRLYAPSHDGRRVAVGA